MSFSSEWLALRETADHAARASDLARAVFAHFAGHESMTIVDLGCGTGSNLRAMAPYLPKRQTWRLVDWDEALLDAARGALIAWADEAVSDGTDLRLTKGDRDIRLQLERADLARDLEHVLERPADLVTATAFFDLVSADWIDRFCAALMARRLPLYAILTYDGQENWQPPHPSDAPVLAAFHAHQAQDKGFGPAAGPYAAPHLSRALEDGKYSVMTEPSPWRLGREQAQLISELAKGAADAVAETGLVSADVLASWREARLAAQACIIGHIDLFARPS